MTKEQEQILHNVKAVTIQMVVDVRDHMIEHHIHSEREMELLQDFALTLTDGIKSIEPDESTLDTAWKADEEDETIKS